MHPFRLLTCGLVLLSSMIALPTSFAQRGRTLSAGLKRDRNAILALQMSISDPGKSKVSSWKSKGNPCFPKPWKHISCGGGRVVSIDLANLEITGTLPAQLKHLNKLTSLNLENNKFAGTIPSAWAGQKFMRSLSSLNLGNNLLNGDLPNRKWNSRGAFRVLETLILSGNQLTGGLPDGWLSTANTFRKLKFLDLAENKLGFAADGSTPLTAEQWCPAGRTGDSGWCPATVNKARAPVLEILDVSENGLTGALPSLWPQMFPNLQFLHVQRNLLFSSTDTPAALPSGWTRRTVPRAFPQLQALVLYPGNDNICSILDAAGQFADINGDLSYSIESDDGEDFDSENPWFCPGPSADNPPTFLTHNLDASNIRIWWRQAATPHLVFGYRFSLCSVNPDTEECSPIPAFTGKVLQVFGGLGAGMRTFGTGPNIFIELDTGIPTTDFTQYRMELSTLNMDGVESSAEAMDFSAVPKPSSVDVVWNAGTTFLEIDWQPPSPSTGVDAYLLTITKYDPGSDSYIEVPGYTDRRFDSAPAGTPHITDIVAAVSEEYKVRVWSFNDATGARSNFFQSTFEVESV